MSGRATIKAILLWAALCVMIMSAFASDQGFAWAPLCGAAAFGILLYRVYRPGPIVEGSEPKHAETVLTSVAFVAILVVAVVLLRLTDEHWSSRVTAVSLFVGFALVTELRGRRRRAALTMHAHPAQERQNV